MSVKHMTTKHQLSDSSTIYQSLIERIVNQRSVKQHDTKSVLWLIEEYDYNICNSTEQLQRDWCLLQIQAPIQASKCSRWLGSV